MLRKELFELIQREGGFAKVNIEKLIPVIEERTGAKLTKDTLKESKQCLKFVVSKIKGRWQRAGRVNVRFIKLNEDWLNQPVDLPVSTPQPSTSAVLRGRPSVDFSQMRREAKRKATGSLTVHAADKLLHAAKRRARSEGRRDLSFVIKAATETPTRPTKVRRILQRPASIPRAYTREQALALFVDANHTKATWQLTTMSAKEQGANIYPAYREVSAGKSECYPDGIQLQPTRAEVPLQSLVRFEFQLLVTPFFQNNQ